jgi:hypothetical protein
MNKAICCTLTAGAVHSSAKKTADGAVHPSSAKRCRSTLAKFSLPTLILALLPKCPACFAAYVALGTGISLSMPVASLLRTLLIGISVALLIWILAGTFRSALMNRLHSDSRLY